MTPEAKKTEAETIALEVADAIRSHCVGCNGTGILEHRPATFVSRDMAVDAGDPMLEGSVFQQEEVVQCEYCGRTISAVMEVLGLRLAQLEKLPLSGDGVRIYPGMKVYHVPFVGIEADEWTVRSIRFNPNIEGDLMIISLQTDKGDGSSARGWQLYSTKEAALAAAIAGGGGERREG